VSSQPDLSAHFAAMEALVEAQPEGVNAEIARGVYLMSPRPSVRHSAAQVNLVRILTTLLGRGEGGPGSPDWLFLIEPEIRSEITFSRLIPDLAGWRKSSSGWPDPETNPLLLVPEWVAEILSKHTRDYDRGPKRDAYGSMGVGWLWFLDVENRRIETFGNVRGRMIPGPSLESGQQISAPPFPDLGAKVDDLFLA